MLHGPFPDADPFTAAAKTRGAHIGLLVLPLPDRSRLRINTVVHTPLDASSSSSSPSVTLRVLEAFGNCPKYIQKRHTVPAPTAPQPTTPYSPPPSPPPPPPPSSHLSPAQTALIQTADTFFIATAHPARGADASHRGGRPGFVRVESPTHLWWPDYPGNGLFNTLGNIAASAQAGLVFVDWDRAATLHLHGRAELEHAPASAPLADGSPRLVHLHIDAVRHIPHTLPYRFTFSAAGASPFNPKISGRGADRAPAQASAARLRVVLLSKTPVTANVATFRFRPDPAASPANPLLFRLRTHFPGEYVTFDLTPAASPTTDATSHTAHAKKHSSETASASLTRSWTISSAPSVLIPAAPTEFTISVKREPHGLASRFLHDRLRVGDALDVLAVDGGGQMSLFQEWPVDTLPPDDLLAAFPPAAIPAILRNVAYSTIATVTAGIGITPVMANLRAFAALVRHAGVAPASLPAISVLHSSRSSPPEFAAELAALHADGIIANLVLHSTAAGERAHPRRIARPDLEALLPSSLVVSVFMCGPAPFMDAMSAAMVDDMGLNPAFLHKEDFYF